jgi:hypothetical protein
MSKMGFGYLKHNLWPKEGSGVKSAIWLLITKIKNYLHFLACKWRATYRGMFSTRATTLLQTSPQLEVCRQNYEIPKSREFLFKEFRDSHLGTLRQNDVWVLTLWLRTENTIRGKVVDSPKFGPWWVLWVRVYSSLVHAWKVLELCTKQLVV